MNINNIHQPLNNDLKDGNSYLDKITNHINDNNDINDNKNNDNFIEEYENYEDSKNSKNSKKFIKTLEEFEEAYNQYKLKYLELMKEIKNPSKQNTWQQCATDNSGSENMCELSDTHIVRYGSNNKWIYKHFPDINELECTSSIFDISNTNNSDTNNTNICETLKITDISNINLLNEYQMKSEELLIVAENIQKRVRKMHFKDIKMKRKISNIKNTIHEEILNLQNIQKEIFNSVNNIDMVESMDNMESVPINNTYSKRLSNIRDDSRYKLDSNYLKYIIWLLTSIFLVLLSFHTFTATDQSLLVQLVIGIAIIILTYNFSQYIYNKLV